MEGEKKRVDRVREKAEGKGSGRKEKGQDQMRERGVEIGWGWVGAV